MIKVLEKMENHITNHAILQFIFSPSPHDEMNETINK